MTATASIRVVRTRRSKTLVNAVLQTLFIAGVPMPTPDLIALHGKGRRNPRQSVTCALNWMLKTQRVRKEVRLHPKGGCVAWWEPIPAP